jgi:hypothetical protein
LKRGSSERREHDEHHRECVRPALGSDLTIQAQPHNDTSELWKLARQAIDPLAEVAGELPRIQGRHIARWLRDVLRKNTQTDRVEPEELLCDWHVAVIPFSTDRRIEAISFCGPAHGPAILLNAAGRRNKSNKVGHGFGGSARANSKLSRAKPPNARSTPCGTKSEKSSTSFRPKNAPTTSDTQAMRDLNPNLL